ncbi:MAG: hypothetical protein PUJ55_02610, partial [Clostridiales bacterium]|nr:hypothetical protein [Clostridiales bacterium]MDY4111714.1 hypothetical protein [Roseburia sp.]
FHKIYGIKITIFSPTSLHCLKTGGNTRRCRLVGENIYSITRKRISAAVKNSKKETAACCLYSRTLEFLMPEALKPQAAGSRPFQ